MNVNQNATMMAANTGQAQMMSPKGTRKSTRSQRVLASASADVSQGGSSSQAATQGALTGTFTETPKVRRRRRYQSAIERPALGATGAAAGKENKEARKAHRFERPRHERQELLRASFSDNSREIQARFLADHGPTEGPHTTTGKLANMVSRLSKVVQDQLGQFTGDEPYRRADYRLFLEAFQGLRNGPKKEPEDPWAGAKFGKELTSMMSKAVGVFDLFNNPIIPGTEFNDVI
ncbi:MAG: hypothetical protein AB7S38_07490 [Vulcanimicrobiota bacterium]